MIYAMMADGLEEVECLAVLDILKRAGSEICTVTVTGDDWVTGAHGIRFITDKLWNEVQIEKEDTIFLPGGMPGTIGLREFSPLCDRLIEHDRMGGRISAICAAPSVLGDLGLLSGKKATCYPGWESHLTGATVTGEGVVMDGNITTAKGMGRAIDLGLELVRQDYGEEKAAQIAASIQYDGWKK